MKINEIIDLLSCPDDNGSLSFNNNVLSCSICDRKFTLVDNFIDFLPNSKIPIHEIDSSQSVYNSIYQNLISQGEPGKQWKSFGIIYQPISIGFIKETTKYIEKIIDKDFVVCDVGAGTGDYSVNLSKKCKVMFHVDLDMNGIRIAQQNSQDNNTDNIFFLRCDYLKLPFKRNIMDVIYSVDVIERGIEHDSRLLKEVAKSVKKGGTVIFDCHSRERLKLTHADPKIITLYSKENIIQIAKQLSLQVVDVIGTGFLPQLRKWSEFQYNILNYLAKRVKLPPARWILICRRE